jgi:ribosomal protein S12 methylthiotransferase accessory factor YcaO
MNGLRESTSLTMPTVKVSLPAGCCSCAVTPGAAVSASSAASTTVTEALRARLAARPFPPALLVAPTPGPLAGIPHHHRRH